MFNKIKFRWIIGIIVMVFIISKCTSQSGNKLEVVRSIKAKHDDMKVTIAATGEIKPQNRVEIRPPIGGRLEEVLVKEGEEVHQGQILAWMSSTDRAALLDAARAKGPEVLKEWETAYKAAPLISPLEGTVIVQTIQPGQTIATSDAVVVISDRLIAKALVDETDLAQISLNQLAEIQLDAYHGKTMPAKVDHINYESTLINNVNVYSVDVVPAESSLLFRSGMTATITFIVMDRRDVLVIPADAVVGWPRNTPNPTKAEFAVYKKRFPAKLKPSPIKIGESDGQNVEVLEGLKKGEEIQVIRRKRDGGKNPFGSSSNQQQRQKREQRQ